MQNLLKLTVIIILFAVLPSCKGDGSTETSVTVPVIATNQVTAITQTTAVSGGSITSDGGATITAKGICWSIGATPTITDNKTTNGNGTGSFTSDLTALVANTTYNLRAYATNSAGTGYGSVISFSTLSLNNNLTGPYLGQSTPVLTPQVFAPGVISISTSFDFAPSFSRDGRELYFTRRIGTAQNVIYETHQVNGEWTTPAPTPFSSGYMAFEPHVTYDNRVLYFGWSNPGGEGIWAVDRTESGWSAPRFVGPGMYVSSDSSEQVYVTNLTTNPPSLAKVTVSGGIFTNYTFIRAGAHPCIAPDGSYLIYDINGGTHLMVSFKLDNGTWGTAIDLTQHGFPASAGIGSISPDGRYFFYLYNSNIYWVSTDVIKSLR